MENPPSTFAIAGRQIGFGHPAFVIAEIGVNHDGSLRRAMELVELAAAAGADAVKLQIFSAGQLMHGSSTFAHYQRDRTTAADPAAMLRRYELSAEQVQTVVTAIKKQGLIPLATPFSPADVQIIAALNLPAVKIASPDIVNLPLLQKVSALGRPVIASTGAATIDEIAQAVGWLKKWNTPLALLHCISSYPTPAASANLCWIAELVQRFSLPVGLSDHTTQTLSGPLAVAGGAVILEKHLTYDRTAIGPDHSASADPHQFADYVRQVRLAESLLGKPGKRVLDIERDVRTVSRQSLVTARDLPTGHAILPDDLTVQRPGTGISAAEFTHALGRKTITPIQRGTLLQWDMLADAA